jgi:hypothetical protein
MPVKEKVNKSAEIRKLHASGLKSASEIVAKLKDQGIKATPALVYNVLANKKSKNKSKKRLATASQSGSGEKQTVIDTAIVFVKSAGGMQKARDLLAKISLLQN